MQRGGIMMPKIRFAEQVKPTQDDQFRRSQSQFQLKQTSGSEAIEEISRQTSQLDFKTANTVNDHQFVLPDRSMVMTVPGIFGRRASVSPLAEYLSSKGHNAMAVQDPYVILGQSLYPASRWLADKIDATRVIQAQKNLELLITNINNSKQPIETVRDAFHLDDSKEANKIATLLYGLIQGDILCDEINTLTTKRFDGNFKRFVLEKKNRRKLSSVLENTYKSLLIKLQQPNIGLSEQEAKKTAHRLIDTIAPRFVMIAHSKGGLASAMTLQNAKKKDKHRQNGVGLVITLSSPLAGIEITPEIARAILGRAVPDSWDPLVKKLFNWGQKIFSSLSQMEQGSETITSIQHTALPFDSSIISISNAEDTFIKPKQTELNPWVKGTLNLKVDPPKDENVTSKSGMDHHQNIVDYQESMWGLDGTLFQSLFSFDSKNTLEKQIKLKRLLDVQNYEPLREVVLKTLIDKLEQAATPQEKEALRVFLTPLMPKLKLTQQLQLPFEDSANKLAEIILNKLKPQATAAS